MQVLVVHEFYEEDGHKRHWPGQIMTVDAAFFDLYRPFLKEVKSRREVTK